MLSVALFCSSIVVACTSSPTLRVEAVSAQPGTAAASGQVAPDAVMLRFPDVSKDQIVFRYAGDLWLVDRKGGVARAISSPSGNESFAKFSPDGQSLAFVAGYDGAADVYVLPIDGGVPTRVTHHPVGEILSDWHPNGRELIFHSNQISGQARAPKLFTVSSQGGQPAALPVPYGAFGTIDETGTWLAYTPVSQSEFRTWKRYQGGMAQDVWLFNLKTNQSKRVTDFKGTDCLPMWHGGELYFLSDRAANGRLNVHRYDVKSGATTQVTDFAEFDVRFPSVGPDDIVFENGGKLHRYEFATSKVVPVEVVIPTDRPKLRETVVDVSSLMHWILPSPKGKRVIVEARGEIFSAPVKDGVVLNLTQSDGVAERFPAISPDGKSVAYMSDRSGEYELWVRPLEGDGSEEKQLTRIGPGFKFAPSWAPDSKSLVFSTNDGALHHVVVEGGAHQVVATNPAGFPMSAAWSPDSRWLAYAHKSSKTRLGAIYLHDLSKNERHEVTSGMFSDGDPTFDAKGDWLFFTSSRTFEAIYSDFDETWAYANATNLMAAPLRADVKNPWAPKDDSDSDADDEKKEKGEKSKDGAKPDDKKKDEVAKADDAKADDGKNGDAKGDDAKDEAPKPVEIEIAGLEARARIVDVPPGRIYGTQGAEGKVAYLRGPRAGAGGPPSDDDEEGPPPGAKLVYYDLEEKKEVEVLGGVSSFDLTADGKKALVDSDGWAIVDLAKDQKVEKRIALDGLRATIDPRREWRQILSDAGRIMRDYFYVAELHGVDWSGVVARYTSALADCTARDDVDYLIREMIAELNVGHAYNVSPPQGMESSGPAVPVGLLGCDWTLEDGRYEIARILGSSYDADARSPLALPGVDARVGDGLIAVNGRPVDATKDVYAAFVGTAGKPTWLTLGSQERGERRVLVEPLASESELRYRDWVARNRELVATLSQGRIGYVHVPDTGIRGQNELVRQFMAQYHCDALIVDERWNGGGQIPTRFIELLDRPITNYWAPRHGEDWTWPQIGHRGPKAMLINESSGSGGDCFPYYFRQSSLGKLIGTRTWGGLVGISGNPGFIDGSAITVPTFGFYEKDGTWGVEGHGVDPDIEVIDDPAKMVDGKDPQLQAAIDHLQAELRTYKFDQRKRPASPDRSKSGVRPDDH